MSTVFRHDDAAPWTVLHSDDDPRSVQHKLDHIAAAVEALDARRQELEELVTDLMPAVNGALGIAIRRLDELEKNGTLAFARDAAAAFARVAQTVDPQRLQYIADNADALLRLAELAASPQLGAVLERTVEALGDADKGRPPKLRQLFRATREPRVRRGLAATLKILRAIGSGTRGAATVSAVRPPRPVPSTIPAPAARAVAARPAAQCAAPSAPSPAATARTVAGADVAFDAEGFMTDSGQWTREIAASLAAENGIARMTDDHWKVIEFCRSDAASNGVSPGLRRITTTLGIAPREMYRLFPKGPGMLAARIAGLPKPKSCV